VTTSSFGINSASSFCKRFSSLTNVCPFRRAPAAIAGS
jgi:hypothetical protein